MKAIIFSHGEKGGVGKSTVASVLVDALRFGAQKRVILIEGDVRTDDVFNRYREHVQAVKFNLADQSHYQNAVSKMLEFVEQNADRADAFVVNLPATATATIDRDVEMIAAALAGCSIDMRVVYSASSNPAGISTVAESFERGLASHATRSILLAQEFFGDDDLVCKLKSITGSVAVFPALASYTYSAVMEKPEVPLSMLADKNCAQSLDTFIQRIRLANWLDRATKTLKPIINDFMPQE